MDTNWRRQFDNLFEKKVVLYGAGVTGVEMFKILTNYYTNVQIECFCDTYKTGNMNGVTIISPMELKELCETEAVVIIVTGLSTNNEQIVNKLNEIGIRRDHVLTLQELDQIVLHNLSDVRIDEWYRTIKLNKFRLIKENRCNLYINWWCPEHYCPGDILIYQPGKVGSVTVCNSLSKVGVNITHVHMLKDHYIYDLIPELAWKPDKQELEMICESSASCIEKIKKEEKNKIITLVREPISRDYSLFFYHLKELYQYGYLSKSDSIADACMEGMIRRATLNGICKYGYEFEWFNHELKEVFGVDVYDYAFDKEKGYTVIEQENIQVLVIKLEKLDELEQVIGDFCCVKNFKLYNANEASKNDYYQLYSSIKETIKIPREIISMYYDHNKYMDHFYTEEEKKAFMNEWDKN